MTAPRVTSCPHCKTSFRITQAQLRAANGSVRCGSCLQVFDAKSSADKETSPQPKEKTVTAPSLELSASNTEEPLKPVSSTEPEQNFSKAIRELDEKEGRLTQFTRKQRQQNYLWSACAVFFVLILLFQYAWFNKDTLSLNSTLHPAYEWLCKTASCTLPPRIDIASMKSLQLMVRSHPDQEDALVVDAVIINNAEHFQPYPILDLSFTDINGNLVANREFSSQEYLAGELAGSKKMPIGQPIRLALEIIDPGQDAVNYALRFNAAQ